MPPTRRRNPAALLVVLALLAGAGFLATGLVGLFRALQAEAQRGRAEAARDLRRRLADPRLLDAVAAERRFTVRDGAVVVPEEVGWLLAPPPRVPGTPAAWRAAQQIEQAHAATPDGDGAEDFAARLAPALAEAGGDAEADAALRLVLAWHAHRHGAAAARDAHLAALPAEPVARLAPSLLLLHAATGRALPSWSERALRGLDEPEAAAVLARLAELRPDLDLAPLAARQGAAAARRALLRAVHERRDALRALQGPGTVLAGATLLVWFPDAAGGSDTRGSDTRGSDAASGNGSSSGSGASLGAAELRALHPGREFALANPLPEAAEPVIPGQLGIVAEAASGFRWSGPRALAALLVALGALLALLLALAFRTVRRETLALQARAEFLTSVTHELKTPLAGIRLLAEMLEQGRVTDEGRRGEYHRLLAGETARLSTLIENVLDLGRLERGERALDPRPLRYDDVAREAAELVRPLCQRDGLDVATDLAPVPAPVAADRGALIQALLNVLDNARKYAPGGLRITVAGRADGATYTIAVRDFGPGVPEGERERIFARFQRGAAQRDGHVPGLGIGLHLARELVRRHGGDLVCLAPADGGAGACFEFRLPLAGGRA
ncbi:MAG: HAMP domain-containing histidine kinase [Planctomycetes bacterium]|nr:HAMP domain-containing histidine kinase [Planctomycetota bacterium]